MLKISTVIFILQAQQSFGVWFSHENRPNLYEYEYVANIMHHNYLNNMTENFCKDVENKLVHARAVQNIYANTSGYELGIIAANIMDIYRHMLRVYRYYSNHKGFKNEDYNISQIMNGYAVMHGDYNEIAAQTNLFYEILAQHTERKDHREDDAQALSVQYGLSVDAIRDMQKKGLNPADFASLGNPKSRRSMRSMDKETNLPKPYREQFEEKKYSRRQFLMGDSSNINTWTPKKNVNNMKEEEYKKRLRYQAWAKKWNGFNGETEGVQIADTIAKLGINNDSSFLLKELKGAV